MHWPAGAKESLVQGAGSRAVRCLPSGALPDRGVAFARTVEEAGPRGTVLSPSPQEQGHRDGAQNGARGKSKPKDGAAAQEPIVDLPAPDIRLLRLPVVGTSPLICHRWSEKAKGEMRAKQMKRAKTAKEAKDPEEDYRASLYEHPDGGYGFPSIAFKAAMVRAGTYQDLKMTFLRGAFHVLGELVPIEGTPRSREDMVRVGQGVADIRYRGEFAQWSTLLPIRYNARVISAEQIANLAQEAGFAVGVGEWRPERDGNYGTFEVVRDE